MTLMSTKTSTPSKPITEGQIGKVQELLGAALRKHASEFTSETVQLVVSQEGDALQADLLAVVRKRVEARVSTTMTIGDRTYEILGFLQGDEKSVPGSVMVERAEEMQANLGQEDGQYLLDHQEEIPEVLRGKVVFVFPAWRHPVAHGGVACVDWDGCRWLQGWDWLDRGFRDGDRVLRRK